MRVHVVAWSMALALAAGLPAVGEAVVVHRCRSADGSIAWRDVSCLPDEETVARREVAVPATPSPRSAEAAGLVHEAAGKRAQARTAHAPGRVVAHECRFGEQRWVQAEACPARLAQAGATGTVDETRLTAGDVCAALRGASAGASRAPGSSRRAYAMNRLRQRHGC